MRRVATIVIATVLLAGCGDGGDGANLTPTPNADTPDYCCMPGVQCTVPDPDGGSPILEKCTAFPTPTPGGTPSRIILTCLCVAAVPSAHTPTPTPTLDGRLFESCPITPGEIEVIDGTPRIIFARPCTPTPRN